MKAAQGEARLAAEAAERARGSPDFARHEWQRNLAALKAEVDSQTQALLQIGLRATQVEQEAAELAHELARRKLIAAGSRDHDAARGLRQGICVRSSNGG